MLAIAFGLLAWNYAELLPQLIHAWNIDPNYSHGFVVPVVSLVFARIHDHISKETPPQAAQTACTAKETS